MPYRYKRKERLADGARRVFIEQTARAAGELREPRDPAAAVHQVRKHLKKSRSLLRMVRASLGDDVYHADNDWLRGLAHRMAAARDAEALVETWDQLAATYPEIMDAPPFAAIAAHLRERRDNAAAAQRDGAAQWVGLADELATAPERVARWRFQNKGIQGARPGFVRAYRRGRRALRAAYADPSDAAFHDWRKRVKDHWYHCRLLQRTWREPMAARIAELKTLSDLLGDDHDLAVLRTTLRASDTDLGPAAALVERLATERQAALRERAHGLGQRIYAASPGCQGDQVAAWWHAWHRG